MNNLHQVSKIETHKKMIISPAGRLGEAPLGACVFLWAPEGLEGCRIFYLFHDSVPRDSLKYIEFFLAPLFSVEMKKGQRANQSLINGTAALGCPLAFSHE